MRYCLKNGNLLLNVGPYAHGSFHPDAVKELYAIGDWLKINGEAIYGSRPFTTAAEGPSVSVAQNYDASKIEEQLRTGSEAAMEKSALTSRDFRFTTGKRKYIRYIHGLAGQQCLGNTHTESRNRKGKCCFSSRSAALHCLSHRQKPDFMYRLPANAPAVMLIR